jgi:hypothetical protein
MTHTRRRRVVIGALVLVVIAAILVAYDYISKPLVTVRTESSFTLSLSREYSLGFSFDPERPTSWVATASGDRLVAYDAKTFQLRVYNLNGELLHTFGGQGMSEGHFLSLSGIALDDADHLFVADREVPIIRQYSLDGRLISQSSPIDGISGWTDVTVVGPGEFVASPNPQASLLGGRGIYRFSNSKSAQLFAPFFGPVAADRTGTVHGVNFYAKDGSPKQYALVALTKDGKTLHQHRLPDALVKTDLQYWPVGNSLLLVNTGANRIEHVSLDGKNLEVLLQIPASQPAPVAALPVKDELYVITADGLVHVYRVMTQ